MPYVERELLLKDGPPWGFRLQDTSTQGLVISRIRRRSPAGNGGAHEGDVLLAINKNSTNGMSHHRAVQLLESTFYILTIKVGRHETIVERAPEVAREPVPPRPAPVATSLNLNFKWPPPKPEPIPEPEPYFPEPEPIFMEPEPYFLEPEPEPEQIVKPASPTVDPVPISKLIKEWEPPPLPETKKKSFADSAFYDDPDKYFPSVKEQKQMAKKVADSLTAVFNKGSRGAKMFEKRRHKWCADDEEEDVLAVEEPPSLAAPGFPLPNAPPPPNLANLPAAPPPPNLNLLAGVNKKRTTQELFEEAKQLPKTKHDAVAPQQCFDIAAALHASSSRGSQLFAKRRAKSKKWELEGPDPSPAPQELDVQMASPPWAANLKHKPAQAKTFVSNPPPEAAKSNSGPALGFPRGPANNSSAAGGPAANASNVSTASSASSHARGASDADNPTSAPWRPVSGWRPPSTSQDQASPFDANPSAASPRGSFGTGGSVDSESGLYSSLPRPGTNGKQEWRSVQFKVPQKSTNNAVST